MLGIIIGIGAVVAMVSLGQGAAASVQAEIASLGTNVLIIVPGATTVGGVRGGLGSISTLTVDDAETSRRKSPDVTTVMYGSRSVLQVIHENKNWSTVVLGTTPEFHRHPQLAGRPGQLLHAVGHGFRRKSRRAGENGSPESVRSRRGTWSEVRSASETSRSV